MDWDRIGDDRHLPACDEAREAVMWALRNDRLPAPFFWGPDDARYVRWTEGRDH